MREKVEEEALSSPSPEFSFTISLHKKTPSPSFDLSPADDIFFHGHLLPLHISARSSTNSNDTFTHHVTEKLAKVPHTPPTKVTNTVHDQRRKTKSFSFFKWKTSNNSSENTEQNGKIKIVNMLKRYMRMVRPMVSSFSRRKVKLRRQPYSFSGNLMRSGNYNDHIINNKFGFSAPASMRTSPNHSGLLVPSGSSDSTMDELQAAIQAAIAHCKGSNIQSIEG